MLKTLHRTTPTQNWLSILLPALLAMGLATIPSLLEGIPAPVIEDEWGYLLTADTFAEGRLTNPTHRFWPLFESVHQIQVPSYQSKYPPGQSLLLALGQWLWHPILGVWLGVGLMVGSIVWMLQAVMPSRWAWLGGFLVAAQYVVLGQPFVTGTFGYWSQSYWGGALTAAGGAMVYGALPRLLRKSRTGPALAMGLGLVVLMVTRPMEGLIASLPAAYLMARGLVKRRFARKALVRVVLPLMLTVGLGVAALGTYNHAVTGKAAEMPWTTHYEQYCVFPVFLWQDVLPPKPWNHPELDVFYGEVEVEMHERHSDLRGLLAATIGKLGRFWIFYLGPLFTLPLVFFLVPMLRKKWARNAVIPILLVVGSGLLKFGSPPHYSAPITGLVTALIVQSLRYLHRWSWRGHRIGMACASALLTLAAGGIALGLHHSLKNVRITHAEGRIVAEKQLEELPGAHLVLVQYGPLHGRGDHWIWNRADIDGSRVVWVRDPGPHQLTEVLEYFQGRQVWVAEVGFDPKGPKLRPILRDSDSY